MISPKKYSQFVYSIIFFLTWTSSLVYLNAGPKEWPHEGSDLPVDSRVRWGRLNNRFQYALLNNNEPPNEVSMRLLVDAGSLMETDDQQGLAHFIEHMGFNGTKRFSAGELKKYFERIGMAFGADVNAHTSFNETVYKLDLPDADTKVINDGLSVLRNFADGMLFKSKDIEKERGVVLAEKRDRDTINYRTTFAIIEFYLDETLVPSRFPIGKEDVIRTADQKRFKQFYEKWYIPERMLLVVVGNFNLDTMEKAIEKQFGSMKKGTYFPDPAIGKVNEDQALKARLHTEKEAPALLVGLSTIHNLKKEKNNQTTRKRLFIQTLASSILTKRLNVRKEKDENAPFISAEVSFEEELKACEIGSILLTTVPKDWKEALKVAEEELRRALTFGFTTQEVEEIKSKALATSEKKALAAPSRKSNTLANEILTSFHQDLVFTTPEFDYEFLQKIMPEITPEALWKAFKDIWDSGKKLIFITGNLELEDPEKEIMDVYNTSKNNPIEPPIEKEKQEFLYQKFGDKGTVIKETHDEELDVYQYTLSNNVRLNLKPLSFEKNQISVCVDFGRGKLEAAATQMAIPFMCHKTFLNGGLEKYSIEEIESLFAGKAIAVDFSVNPDSFTLTGSTDKKSLRDLLGLMCAYFTAPGYREESLRNARKTLDSFYRSLTQTPEGVINSQVARLIASGNPRFGYPSETEAQSVSMDSIRSFLENPLKTSYAEITIVGDFEPQECLNAILETFGALPKREDNRPFLEKEREVEFPTNTPLNASFPVKSELPKATALAIWPTDDGWDREQYNRLRVLASVFTDYVSDSLREAMGKAYSPYTSSNASLAYNHYGYFMTLAFINPSETEQAQRVFMDIAQKIVQNGITDDEFERAIMPLRKIIDVKLRQISFWLNLINNSQEYPVFLDWIRVFKKSFETMTKEDVQAVANKFLNPQKVVMVQIVPEATTPSVSEPPNQN